MTSTKYTFGDSSLYEKSSDHLHQHHHARRKHAQPYHRRKHSSQSQQSDEDTDQTDGAGSLTYSAASSIGSGAGESTDSSFADIMKVLDGQETSEAHKELANHHHHSSRRRSSRRDEKSVAESLAYSTDAESQNVRSMYTEQSNLQGTALLSTITGQASDQFAYDGGGNGSLPSCERDDPESISAGGTDDDTNLNILFQPAEHTDSLKRRKDRKRREKLQQRRMRAEDKDAKESNAPSTQSHSPTRRDPDANATPRVKNGNGSSTTNNNHSRAATVESRQGTPPTSRPPKSNEKQTIEMVEEEDVWYAKWWMFCFPDTHQTLSPKR